MAAATATLRWVMQLHRDVPRAARFYAEGLDFSVNVCTLRWAELQSGPLKLALMHTNGRYELEKPHMDSGDTFFRDRAIHQYFIKRDSGDTCMLINNLTSQRVYSSMLSFTVPDINSTVSKLMALGAELDGPIKYEIHGKVAALRCIDGHMLGLYEPA